MGLIAFMNMANTMIISIITRKRELGVMQALGMPNKQMDRMLRNEGIIFTLGLIVISKNIENMPKYRKRIQIIGGRVIINR